MQDAMKREPQGSEPKRYLSMRQAGQVAGVCERTIFTWIRDDGLPVIKLGRLRRIDPDDLFRFLDSQKETSHAAH